MSAGFDPLGHEPAPGVFDSDEAMRAALALAKNCGYAVFPCSTNKTPTRPATDGGTGYKDASTNPETIEFLWRHLAGTANRHCDRRPFEHCGVGHRRPPACRGTSVVAQVLSSPTADPRLSNPLWGTSPLYAARPGR